MKKLYGSEVVEETEWMDHRDNWNYRDAYMAVKKYVYTANGKKYITVKHQWKADGKVFTNTSRID